MLLNTGSLMTTFSWNAGSRVSKPRRCDERVMTPPSCWNSKPLTPSVRKKVLVPEEEPKLRPEPAERPESKLFWEEDDEKVEEDEDFLEEGCFCVTRDVS